MRKTIPTILAALCLAAGAAHANEGKQPSEAVQQQQARMKACNADAKTKGLKGDERKAFMGDCLKKKA